MQKSIFVYPCGEIMFPERRRAPSAADSDEDVDGGEVRALPLGGRAGPVRRNPRTRHRHQARPQLAV